METINSNKNVVKGRGQTGYLDSIKKDSNILKGSGAAQKTYADTLKAASTAGSKATSGYQSGYPSGLKTENTGDDATMGPGLAIFLSLLFVAAGAVYQWSVTSPEQVEEFLRAVNTVSIEKIQSLPKIVEQLTPPELPSPDDVFAPPPEAILPPPQAVVPPPEAILPPPQAAVPPPELPPPQAVVPPPELPPPQAVVPPPELPPPQSFVPPKADIPDFDDWEF